MFFLFFITLCVSHASVLTFALDLARYHKTKWKNALKANKHIMKKVHISLSSSIPH